jgi:hypothetical protein
MTDHLDPPLPPAGLDEDSTKPHLSKPPLTRRRLGAAAVALVLIAAAVLTITRLGPDDTAADPSGEPWKTDTVTVGDLALSDRLEGTLERASELVVVHRISGVAPGTNSSNNSGLTAGVIATGTAAGGIGSGGLTATFRLALAATAQCDAIPTPDTSPTSTDSPITTTTDASTTSTTDTSSSSATDTATSDPTTTEPEPTTTTEAEPTTTQPCNPGTTSTTAPSDSIPTYGRRNANWKRIPERRRHAGRRRSRQRDRWRRWRDVEPGSEHPHGNGHLGNHLRFRCALR